MADYQACISCSQLRFPKGRTYGGHSKCMKGISNAQVTVRVKDDAYKHNVIRKDRLDTWGCSDHCSKENTAQDPRTSEERMNEQ